MKYIRFPRILRALTAVVLALLLMFSTVATCFAVEADDTAESGADFDFVASGAVEDLADSGVSSFTRPGGQAIYLTCEAAWANVSGYEPQIHLYTDGDWNGRYDLKGSDIQMVSGSGNTWYYAYIPDNGTTYTHVAVSRGNDTNWSGILALPTNAYENTIYVSGYTSISMGASSYSVDDGHGHLYFDNTNTNWSNVYFYIGRTSDYLNVYPMSLVSNTNNKMYYLAPDDSWDDYRVFGFCSGSFTSGQNFTSFGALATAATKYTTPYSAYNISGANKTFLGYGSSTAAVCSQQIKWITDDGMTGNTSGNTMSTYINMAQTLNSNWGGTTTINGYQYTATGTTGVTAIANPVEVTNGSNSVNLGRRTTATVTVAPYNGYTATATVDGVSQTITNNQFTYNVADAHTVNVTYTATGHPDVMLLGLWTGSVGNAWSADTTNNPDRVMTYMSSGTIGSTNLAGKYYIELTLPGNSYQFKSDDNNGIKLYDYGIPGNNSQQWLGYDRRWYTQTEENWDVFADNGNMGLQTIAEPGNHTYKFVYDGSGSTKKFYVYYPQIVTFNNNESTAVTGGGATSADTTQKQVVAYDATAKAITPTREGYSFVGWYDDRAGNTPHNFSTKVTGATTVYAKWQVNNVQISVHGTNNGVDMSDAVTKNVNGLSYTTLTAAAAPSGTNFRGWVISGDMSSHVRLYTKSGNDYIPYVAGSADTTVYVKTDGSSGITTSNAIVTATYLSSHTVEVQGTTALENFTAISGRSTNPQDIDFGSAVNVSFNNLPAGLGIQSVTFADGEAPDSFVNYGHYISFTMPAHDITITDITIVPFTCQIQIKNATTVDVDGISASGYYAAGADVHTITIAGSDDYYGASVLNSLEVKYVGGNSVTVNSSNDTDTLTFDGYTLTVTYNNAAKTATITGKIGGSVIITPTCSTEYNFNITSKVMSDVGSKYITFNKKSTTADGELESITIAQLNAYLKLASAPSQANAEDLGLEYPLVSKTKDGSTYYLIEADAEGDFINAYAAGSELLLETEDLNDKYTFIGWFTGSSTGPELNQAISTDLTYAYTLNESSFLYAVVTRDIYIGGDGANGATGLNASWSTAAKMTYDEENKVYYYETGSLTRNTNYYFKIFDTANTGNNNSYGTTNQAVWYNAAKTITYNSDYNVTLEMHRSTGTNENAYFNLASTVQNVDGNKVRIYYKPVSQEVYVIPVYTSTYHEVYFSNGRIDGMQTLGLTLTGTTSTFTAPSSPTGTGYTIPGDGTTENYCYYRFTGSYNLAFQTTISGTDAGSVEVAGFVVYNMDTGDAITVSATKNGNVYSGSAAVSANTFICPVYELTDTYLSNHTNIEAYEVFVNAADVDANVWGGLVSMYTFGGSGAARDTNAHWPGQLMLPSGKTFSGIIYQKSGEPLSGVVFENYNSYASFFGKFGKRFNYPDWAQTYDYLEPVTLMDQSSAEDTTLLTFSLKQNNDGYRGAYYSSKDVKKKGPYYLDVYNENNNETKPGVIYDYYDDGLDKHMTLFDNYTFEYLTDKDGKERLNMYGESVGSASAGYYIICVGDVDYLNNTTPNGKSYAPDTAYNGQYSVEWYVYDADGMFLLHTLSDAIYGKQGTNETPYIVDKLLASGYISNPADLKEKSVKISYEAPNTRAEATRFSGQWYANSTNEKVTVYAGVGMIDPNGKVIVPENPQSKTSYGTSSISYTSGLAGASTGTINGLNWASLKLSDATAGAITLTAATVGTSTFKGWYSYNEAADTYSKVEDAAVYKPSFATDSRYFAMFSAQATYYFEYPGRKGLVTYTVKADDAATSEEMSNGGILNNSNRVSEVRAKAAALQNQLRVFNHSIAFTITTEKMDNSNPYEIHVEGTSTETNYALTVYAYNAGGTLVPQGTVSGPYNTAVNVTESIGPLTRNTPADHDDYVFIGWKEYNGSAVVGDYLSTQANFGYSVTKNMSIAPVFGTESDRDADRTNTWKAGIDKNVITQELSEATVGTIYNDSIVSFKYGADTSTLFTPGTTGECGIVIFAQNNSASAAAKTSFTNTLTAVKMQTYVKYMTGDTGTSGSQQLDAAKLSSTYGSPIALKIKAKSLSNLNRADLYQMVDYASYHDGNYKIISYIKLANGSYIFSEAVSSTYSLPVLG